MHSARIAKAPERGLGGHQENHSQPPLSCHEEIGGATVTKPSAAPILGGTHAEHGQPKSSRRHSLSPGLRPLNLSHTAPAVASAGRLSEVLQDVVRLQVLHHDHHTCQFCGETGGRLRVEDGWELEQPGGRRRMLVTICSGCSDARRAAAEGEVD